MSAALSLRRLAYTASRARPFHSSATAFVKVGDAIPSVKLVEKSPGNKVDLSEEIKGKALIIGVPAAFSMCFPNFHGYDNEAVGSGTGRLLRCCKILQNPSI
jgi:2-Cys peroxiredoxin 5